LGRTRARGARGHHDRFPVDPDRAVRRVGIHHDLGCEDGQAAPHRCRSAISWQAASRLRVASGSTGFIQISWRISEALMSGTMRSRVRETPPSQDVVLRLCDRARR
jgi:hypothetical protein